MTLKRNKTIHNYEEQKEFLNELIKNDKYPYTIIIEPNKTKADTIQQRMYYYALLDEFIRVAQESGLTENNKGWWHWKIKNLAKFYDTSTGNLIPYESTYDLLKWYGMGFDDEMREWLRNQPKDILVKLAKRQAEVAKQMSVKSVGDANTKEMATLIDTLLMQIVNCLPQDIIKTSESLSKAICDRYNSYLNSDISKEDIQEQVLILIFETKLKFRCDNGLMFLI